MQWVTLVVALGCARLSQASRGPTPTPTSTHTPLVDNSEEEVDEPCFEPCTCEVKEGVLHVHCDGRGFTNASQVSQSWIRPFKLNLQRNSFRRLYSNGFQHLGNAVSMNLGNNALQDIRVGAFNGLAKLKRLYLHENKLEVFRNDTFAGLEALEYLQADYNVIKRIDSGALRFLYKLRVLILNDNLIPILPAHLFRSVSLTHLDLRGNRLKSLAKDGTLQYIGRSLMELQLEENPWNCSCEAVELLQWLGQIPYTAVVGDVTCEYPFHLHGKDLREIPRKELCADLPDKEHQGERGAPSAGSQPQPLPPNSKHNSHPGRARPTRPSSMVHGSRQNTLASSTSSPYTSAERKEREKQLKPTKRPRSSNRTPPTARSLMPNQNPPVAGYQTRPPIPIICPIRCTCNLHIADLGQTLNCKENGFRNMSQLIPRPLNGRKLFLGGNFIQKLVRSDFWNFSSLDLIHFGNNRISFIQEGAFSSLVNLRTLHLNENELDRLSPHMFLGLQNLRFLYLENNKIGVVDPGTFDSMPSLELLFLNYNALRSLPDGVFSGVKLSRLNLRNNVFQHLPVEGVLEHLRGLVQVDLQQNPWECNCEAAPLKRWLEGLSTMILMGEAVCKSPEKTQGVALRSLSMELLCPELEPQEARELEEQMANSTDAGGNVSVYPTPGLGPLAPPWIDSIPLSVLVLSLLVLFVSAFFAAAALIAYALRVREKLPFRRQGEVDLAGIQMECGIFTEQTHHHHHHHHLHHDLPEKPPLPLAEHNHVYDTILPREAAAKGADPAAASHMCSNPMFKDQQDVDVNQQLQQQQQAQQQQQQQAFAASKECKGGYCPTPEKEKEWTLEVSSSPINTITGAMGALAGLHGNGILCPTVIDSQGPTPKVELVDCLFQLPTPEFRDLPDRYGRPPPCYPRTQDSKQEVRPDQTLVVTTASSSAGGGHGGHSEQGDGEQRPRLRTKPDYMEVLDRSYQF